MKVKVTWTNYYERSPEYTNTAWLIHHGGTMRFYINTGREEAERRFHADIELQPERFTLDDGAEATGQEMPFSDELVIWTNPLAQLSLGLFAAQK